MTESGDLEPRVSALENEMGNVRRRVERTERDVEAARLLAGAADRDTAELKRDWREFHKQNLRLHNATRTDLADLQQRMTAVEQTMGLGFAEMRGKFDAAAAGQAQIVALLDRLLENGG